MRAAVAEHAPESWNVAPLRNLCTRITSGGTPSRRVPEYFGGDVPWVKTMELLDCWLDDSDEHLTEAGLANSSAKLLPAHTVLMAMYGATVGQLGVLRRPMTCNQAACALIADPTVADFRYVYYQLLHARPLLRSLANGAAQQNLSARTIADFEIPVPSLSEQRAIADVLGILDDKIDSNARLAATVLELLPHEIIGVESADWEEMSVSSLAEFVNGGAYTSNATGTGRMVVRIAELNTGPGPSTVYNDIDVPDEKVARPGDILMAWSGSLGVHYWTRPEAVINQHIFKVICSDYPSWFVFRRLQDAMPAFRQTAADKATTMGHIKRHHLEDSKVLVPPPQVLRDLDRRLGPLWSRLLAAESESLALVAMRDALIPELLSGRLRVPEAESISKGSS